MSAFTNLWSALLALGAQISVHFTSAQRWVLGANSILEYIQLELNN